MTGEKRPQITLRAHLLVIVSVGLAATLTILVFIEFRSSRKRQIQADFTRKTQIMSAALQGTFKAYVDVLHSVKSLYDSSEKVERREFRTFVQRLFKRHAGIQALEWIPRVTQGQRRTFEASVRSEGYLEFRITERRSQGLMVPAARRAVYFPVHYVEPYVGNELALGFDLASSAERLAAITRARESGRLNVTGRLTLVQEPHKQYGIIVFLPVYDRKGEPDPSERGRISLKGFVLGVFRVSEMVMSALKAFELDTVNGSLFDRTAPDGKQLLWQHYPEKQLQPHTVPVSSEKIISPNWWFRNEFDMGGRNWTIQFAPTTGYLAMHDFWDAWAILAGGLLFTGMVGYLLFALNGRSAALTAANESMQTEIAERILAEAKVRESEKRYRALVSNLDTGVVVHASDTRILLANFRAQELLGLTEDQMLGKRDIDPAWHFLREDGERLPRQEYPVNAVIKTGDPLTNCVVGVKNPKLKDIVWVIVNAFPEYNENNLLKQIIVTFWDYTQLKLAETALANRTHDLAKANSELRQQIAERMLIEKELKKKQLQIAKDLDVAAGIQQSLIPNHSPLIRSIRVAWRFEPCEQIGGDIFNFLYTGRNHISFYMLDVCGHGVSSALISASVSQFLQTHYEVSDNPSQAVQPEAVLNSLERVFPFDRFDSFFTIVYVTVDYVKGRLSYSCAGHPPPILLHADGALEILDAHGPVIGAAGGRSFQQVEKQLLPGDKIVLYTDGVLDHPNPSGDLFGKQRLYAAIQKHGNEPVRDLMSYLQTAIKGFAGSAKSGDDLSMLVVEYV